MDKRRGSKGEVCSDRSERLIAIPKGIVVAAIATGIVLIRIVLFVTQSWLCRHCYRFVEATAYRLLSLRPP